MASLRSWLACLGRMGSRSPARSAASACRRDLVSRAHTGFAVALILAIVALQPMLIGVLAIMPRPVMAAAMIFTAVFIMISGIQIISSRVLDVAVRWSWAWGSCHSMQSGRYPAAFANAPDWAQPLMTSPLVLATLVALLLNLVFRIGIRRKVEITVNPTSPDPQEITNFIERNAGIWGARRDVINRIEFAVQQTDEFNPRSVRSGRYDQIGNRLR